MVPLRQRVEESDLEVMLRERLGEDCLWIPPYPAIALRLQRLVREVRYTARDVCAVVGADAALVAALLRRANAASFGTTAPIHTLEAAVNRIEIDDLLQLALAQSVGVTANRPGPLSKLRQAIWRSSLLASRLAVELAPRRGVGADEAFLAGLLHDFSAIAVLVGLEDLDVELPVLPTFVWKALVDRLHVPFGATIADRWNLPVEIAHAIGHHHETAHYDGAHRRLVDLAATVDHVNDIFKRAPSAGVAALIVERPSTTLESGWPVSFLVTSNKQSFDAYALGANAVAFRGATALSPNWIAPLVLHTDPMLDMFTNVTVCQPLSDGSFAMVAQPFGIAGPCKQQWFELLERTRPSAS